jgi:hypothetical protein
MYRIAHHEQSGKKFNEYLDALREDPTAKTRKKRGRNQSLLEERTPIEGGWMATGRLADMIAKEAAELQEKERLKAFAKEHAASIE